jgi:hypothetical protein
MDPMTVRWSYGTISVEGDDLIIEQHNTYTTGVFRKKEQRTDSRRVIPLQRLLRVIKLSGSGPGANLAFKIKGEELPAGYQECRDKEDVLALLETLSAWALVEEDGTLWQAGQADVRAATQPLSTPGPTGKVPAMACGNCGGPIPHRARTCPHCGSGLA